MASPARPETVCRGCLGRLLINSGVRAGVSKLSKQCWLRTGFPLLKMVEDALKPRRAPEEVFLKFCLQTRKNL